MLLGEQETGKTSLLQAFKRESMATGAQRKVKQFLFDTKLNG